MRKHPVTPADESDLRLHLGRQTAKRIGLFDILQVALPPARAQAALKALLKEKPRIVLFDVLCAEQLERIGSLMDACASRKRPLFSVGSSGVEMALGAHWAAQGRLTPRRSWPDPGPARPLLVVSGSCSLMTEKQIARALQDGFAEVALDTAAFAEGNYVERAVRQAAEAASRHLEARRSVIVHTAKGGSDPRMARTAAAFARRGLDTRALRTSTAQAFGSALGRVVLDAVEHAGVKRVVIAGGDTSGYAAQALGIEALEMIAPLAPGAPLCRARVPGSPADGLEVSFKAGQLGGVDYFQVVARGRPQRGKAVTGTATPKAE